MCNSLSQSQHIFTWTFILPSDWLFDKFFNYWPIKMLLFVAFALSCWIQMQREKKCEKITGETNYYRYSENCTRSKSCVTNKTVNSEWVYLRVRHTRTSLQCHSRSTMHCYAKYLNFLTATKIVQDAQL